MQFWQKRATKSPQKHPRNASGEFSNVLRFSRSDSCLFPVVFSDTYFRNGRSIVGVLKNFHDYTQVENSVLVYGFYEEQHPKIKSQLAKSHLAIFEVNKSVEFTGVLQNFVVQYDYDISIPAFRGKCFENSEINNLSFRNYVPVISINGEAHEQFFQTFRYGEKCNRVSYATKFVKRIEKCWVSSSDLDRIVKYRSRNVDDVNLSSLSVQNLEDLLLHEKRGYFGMQRSYPVLQPLLMDDAGDVDAQKMRLRYAEHKKLARITIMYTLTFFLLVIITFYITYFA